MNEALYIEKAKPNSPTNPVTTVTEKWRIHNRKDRERGDYVHPVFPNSQIREIMPPFSPRGVVVKKVEKSSVLSSWKEIPALG